MARASTSLFLLRRAGLNDFSSWHLFKLHWFSRRRIFFEQVQSFISWRRGTLHDDKRNQRSVTPQCLKRDERTKPLDYSIHGTLMSNDDTNTLNVLRNFNASGQYNHTIKYFETLKPSLLRHLSEIDRNDQEIIVEYVKALISTNRLHKLRWLFSQDKSLGYEENPQVELPEFRLRLDNPSSQPLNVSLKSSRPKYFFFLNLLKYSISTLLCLATISIIIERVVESLPKGLGFSVGKKVDPVKDVKETLDDVKGCHEVKEELREVIAYLKDPKKFSRLGAKLPKGVLLAGQPGTGKTLLARAVAGEASVPFIEYSAAEFEEMFVGVGARRVRDLFATAKKLAPVIVFIDEMDAVGSRRAFKDSSSARMTLNQLLVELDGFEQNQGVVVICATNSPEALDPALTRPGRLDKIIHIPTPDIRGREEILRHFGSRVVLGNDVDLRALARVTVGMTGADLFNLINIAAIRCSAENESCISMKALETALDRIMVGLERRNPMSLEEKRITSIHEAGHTIAGWLTPGADPVYKATIMARGSSLGVTWHAPDSDRYQQKLYEMEAQLTVCMAGRAAEELIYGSKSITSGCSSDLKSATALARNMVMHWGFGLENDKPSTYIEDYGQISNELRQKIDAAVQNLLEQAYKRAIKLLQENMNLMERLSNALLEFETLDREEINLALQGDVESIRIMRKAPHP